MERGKRKEEKMIMSFGEVDLLRVWDNDILFGW